MSGALKTDADRLTELEELAAHQAVTIEELSDQLAEQWRIVARLEARIEALTSRFAALEEQAREAPPITKPPHW